MIKNKKLRLKIMRINPLAEKMRVKKIKSIRRIEKRNNLIKKEALYNPNN
jgi:hypothetical protein